MAERVNEKTDAVLVDDLQRLDDVADRVRIAGYGQAAPLLQMRESQMRREIVRVAAKKGKDHAEVAARIAALERTADRRLRFEEEMSRARLDRAELTDENFAGIWGRVADAGKPVENMIVTAFADNERVDFRCTDDNGAFAMEVPAGTPLVLSVRSSEGAELHRDPAAAVLRPGEQRFREIDLTRAPQTPCHPPDDKPVDATFPMIDLVGQTEQDAMAIIRTQGLKLGKRSEQDSRESVGRVIAQDPRAGMPVQRGAAVAITVGRSNAIPVPNVVGLTLEKAERLLKESELLVGKVSNLPVVDDNVGLVVKQDPEADGKASRGAAVSLQVGVKRGGEFVEIANLAEERLREDDVEPRATPGFLAQRLDEAGVKSVPELEELLKQKPAKVRDRLEFPNLSAARKAISALKKAMKSVKS